MRTAATVDQDRIPAELGSDAPFRRPPKSLVTLPLWPTGCANWPPGSRTGNLHRSGRNH